MPQYLIQQKTIADIGQSDVVLQAIKNMGNNVTVSSISFSNDISFTLSNSSILKIERDTSNSRPGECYDLLPLKIKDITCYPNP